MGLKFLGTSFVEDFKGIDSRDLGCQNVVISCLGRDKMVKILLELPSPTVDVNMSCNQVY